VTTVGEVSTGHVVKLEATADEAAELAWDL
jgi:hypothetical protein